MSLKNPRGNLLECMVYRVPCLVGWLGPEVNFCISNLVLRWHLENHICRTAPLGAAYITEALRAIWKGKRLGKKGKFQTPQFSRPMARQSSPHNSRNAMLLLPAPVGCLKVFHILTTSPSSL